jgi:hypothetical protein
LVNITGTDGNSMDYGPKGSIVPVAGNSQDLGSQNKKWNNIYATRLKGTADKADKIKVDINGSSVMCTLHFANGVFTIEHD